MPLADVLNLVADLSQGQADVTAATNYYHDIVAEMGQTRFPSCVAATYVGAIAGQFSYLQGTTAIDILAVAFNEVELPRVVWAELYHYDAQWTQLAGTPAVWSSGDETVSQNQIGIVPVPAQNGTAIGGATPFTTAQAPGNLVLLTSQQVATVHPEEELWIALEILAREFARDSDHTDHATAATCRSLATIFRELVDQVLST